MTRITHIFSRIKSAYKHNSFVVTVAVAAVILITYAFLVNHVLLAYPQEDGFSLTGRKVLIGDSTVWEQKAFLLTYSNSQSKEKILIYDDAMRNPGDMPIVSYMASPDPQSLVATAILTDDSIVYPFFYRDGVLNIKKISNRIVSDINIQTEQLSNWQDSASVYLSQIGDLPKQDQTAGTVHVEDDGLPFFAAGNTAWFFSFFYVIGYFHHDLIVDKPGGTSHTVYSLGEFVFGQSHHEIKVVGYSLDRSLAIINIFKYNSTGTGSAMSRYYAYDIAHDKWALLTDNPNERVLALR